MSGESVCHVARSWVEVGGFHTRLCGEAYGFYSVSPEYFGFTLVLPVSRHVIPPFDEGNCDV
jgi:hypothetical protein